MDKFRDDIRTEIRERLGNTNEAEIDLVTVKDGNRLSGQDIPAAVHRNPPRPADWNEKSDTEYRQ